MNDQYLHPTMRTTGNDLKEFLAGLCFGGFVMLAINATVLALFTLYIKLH